MDAARKIMHDLVLVEPSAKYFLIEKGLIIKFQNWKFTIQENTNGSAQIRMQKLYGLVGDFYYGTNRDKIFIQNLNSTIVKYYPDYFIVTIN
jgi:hypothetical protein